MLRDVGVGLLEKTVGRVELMLAEYLAHVPAHQLVSLERGLPPVVGDLLHDAPMLVERVVKDIDAIVKQVSYDGWEATLEGDRLVRRHVRQVLRKHRLHQTEGLFERAYEYIAEHY